MSTAILEANGVVVSETQDIDTNTEAAEATASAEQEKLMGECEATLKKLVSVYTKGEREEKTGYLETGRLCALYIAQRIALLPTDATPSAAAEMRGIAIKIIEGRLMEHTTRKLDANRLIRAYEAYRLLDGAKPIDGKRKENFPYEIWKDHLSRLVKRDKINTSEEGYTLLDCGMEEDCKACFQTAAKDRWNEETLRDKVATLVKLHTKLDHDRTAAQAKLAREAAEKTKEDAKAAAADTAQAEAEKKALEAQEAKAKQEGREEAAQALSSAIAQADEDLRQKQRDEIEKNALAAEQQRKKAQAEQDEKNAKLARERQEAKDKKKLENQEKRPQAPEARQENYLQTAQTASANAESAKDVAEMVAKILQAAKNPDGVFLFLIGLLADKSSKLTQEFQEICGDFLECLIESEKAKKAKPAA